MTTSAFGVEHAIAKADSATLAAGSVGAGGAAYGTHLAARKARRAVPTKRGAQFLHAFATKDVEGMTTHLRGASSDAKKLVALHAATPALGLAAAGLAAGALASRPRRAPGT